jgi:hypothetical protein
MYLWALFYLECIIFYCFAVKYFPVTCSLCTYLFKNNVGDMEFEILTLVVLLSDIGWDVMPSQGE